MNKLTTIKSSFCIMDKFLPPALFDEMEKSWPKIRGEGVRAMNDLNSTDPEYKTFITQHDEWFQFHNTVFSKKFWADILKQGYNSKFIDDYNFNRHYQESRNGVVAFSDERKFFYSRIDIGEATAGYGINNGGRGNHIDNRQRVISGLLYFTDQLELRGGEFAICTEGGHVLDTIPLRKNRAVISIQNANAWHKVIPLEKGIRKFIYFALSANWDIWKGIR